MDGEHRRPASSAPGSLPCDKRSVLDVREVVKTYVLDEDIEVRALCGVDLSVCEGEMLAIMGPSGSGKSTLMHIIGLLDSPTTGIVTVEGEDVSGMSANQLAEVRNRQIGFVFQSFNLLSRTTATANVELPLIYGGVPAGDRTRRAQDALRRVGLGERLTHTPNQLSGELNREGITVVIVTHDDDVARHASRIVHIRDGKIVEEERVTDRIDARVELAQLQGLEASDTSWEQTQADDVSDSPSTEEPPA